MTDNENIEKPQQENQDQFEQVLTQAKADGYTGGQSKGDESVIEGPLPPDVTNMVTLANLLGLIGFIGPLVIWLLKKDEHKFINEQVKEILNYQMSLMIYFFGTWLLFFIFIGFVILPVLMVMHIIFVIIASVKSSEGKPYRYPIAIRFLK